MFGLFGSNDWNVIAIIFERPDLFQISGQRAKGGASTKARDGAKGHSRTIMWAVFDQQGSLKDSGQGSGAINVPKKTLEQLDRELRVNRSILDVLKTLETKQAEKIAKPLVWTGYPKKDRPPAEDF